MLYFTTPAIFKLGFFFVKNIGNAKYFKYWKKVNI